MVLDGAGKLRVSALRVVEPQLGIVIGAKDSGFAVCQVIDQGKIGSALAVDLGQIGLDAAGVEFCEDRVHDASVGRRATVKADDL